MYLAIDIGGTKTLLASFDKSGKVTEQFKFPTPKDYSDFKGELSKAVANLTTDSFEHACVAAPGRLDRDRGIGIAFGNLPWENVPIVQDVQSILNCPVLFENDAKLAGLSEAVLLKDEFRKVLYLTVSTGIGAALIIDGKIDEDFENVEAGHMLLEHDGQLMRWEEFASGRAVAEKYGKRVGEITDPRAWYEIGRNLAIGITSLIATLTPEVIVIGGGAGAHLAKYEDRLKEQLAIYENEMLTVPPIVRAKNPDEAVIYGCYELIKQHHEATAHKS